MRTASPPVRAPRIPRVRSTGEVGCGRGGFVQSAGMRAGSFVFFWFAGAHKLLLGVEKVEVIASPFFSCSLALRPFYSLRAYAYLDLESVARLSRIATGKY
jgi:hypothetical protein